MTAFIRRPLLVVAIAFAMVAASCAGGSGEERVVARSVTSTVATSVPSTVATIAPAAPTTVPPDPAEVTAPAIPDASITPLWLTIFSHNERTLTRFARFRDNRSDYVNWRKTMIDTVRLLTSRGVHFSWQSDYLMIEAMENFEADALAADPSSTDGLPIINWMSSVGVSIEPHAHECFDPVKNSGDCTERNYNYADVAHVIESYSGITPAPVIGGTSNAERSIDDFTSCLHGNSFDVDWCPSIVIGFAGEAGGHSNDDHHSGVWRPAGFDVADFPTDDPAGTLVNVGRGYSLGAFSNAPTSISPIDPLTFIHGLTEMLSSGAAQPGKMYTATVNFNEDSLVDDGLIDDIGAFLDDIQPLVDEGRVVYANFPETVAAWRDHYSSEPNIWAWPN